MKDKCIHCGGGKLIHDVELLDTGRGSQRTATLILDKDPNAIFLKDPSCSDVNVSVCEDCGFIHFFARDLAELIRARKIRVNNLDESGLTEQEMLDRLYQCKNCKTPHTQAECPKCGVMA